MKIGIAQTRPFKGDIARNIGRHRDMVELAAGLGAGILVFPELSITGYEPELAADLAVGIGDPRLDVFQTLSDRYAMTLGVGMPVRTAAGIQITMILFQPLQPRESYAKQYLHADEEPFFVGGSRQVYLNGRQIALAICYELSVPAHSAAVQEGGASVYLVSVAKTAAGMEKAGVTLAEIAHRYGMTVLISNCVGACDNFESGGGSAVWNSRGELLAQLDDHSEGVLVLDTETLEVAEKIAADGVYENQ